MSNRLFFTVPLVLMGVLSGCNTVLPFSSTKENTAKNTVKVDHSYLKNDLVCSDMPPLSSKALSSSDALEISELVSLGQNVGTRISDGQSCLLLTSAYQRCSTTLNIYNCIQGYVYNAFSYDNKDIFKFVEDQKKFVENKKAEQAKARAEAEAERQAAINRQLQEQILAKQKAEAERKKQQEPAFARALQSIAGDDAGKNTIDIIIKKWDEKSRDEFRQDPTLIGLLYKDVKSGIFYKVEALAEKARNTDGGTKSNLDYYKLGSQAYYQGIEDKKRAYLEQLASNETKLNADLYWYTSQINERKLKLSKLQSGTKEYAETVKELDHLNNELIPLNLAKDLIKQREQDVTNRRIAQERDYQQRQLDQQRQAQQDQLEYQRSQLGLQLLQIQQAEDAAAQRSFDNTLKSLEEMNRRNRPVTCQKIGGVTTCY